MDNNKPYYKKVTDFFEQYLCIPDDFKKDGVLTEAGIRVCVSFLLMKGVFTDKKEMQIEAFKTFRIILPNWFFTQEGAYL